MSVELIGVLGIALLFFLLCMRMYIGIVMALIGFLGFGLLADFETSVSLFGVVPYSTAHQFTFTVLPLFVLMGQFAFQSGISADIYRTVDSWFGQLPGGLAMATIVGCALFGAICGSSLATAATMGAVALPEMKKYNYDPGLAAGSIAVGGTLGILIPPSIGFVIYGIMVEESIGKLFMAGILPGILLTLFYMATVYITCIIKPEKGPRAKKNNFKGKDPVTEGDLGHADSFCPCHGRDLFRYLYTHRGRRGRGLRGICHCIVQTANEFQITHLLSSRFHADNFDDLSYPHRGQRLQCLYERFTASHAPC